MHRKTGIFLIEVLIILAITLIIAAILFPIFSQIRDTNNVKKSGGIVLSKEFHPAHDEQYLQPMSVGKTTVLMPMTRRIDDEWVIELQLENGKIVKARFEQYIYDKLKIGDFYRDES